MYDNSVIKEVTNGQEVRNRMLNGVNALADTVKTTLGPLGRNVVIEEPMGPHITKDGVTVAKAINLGDPIENLGAQIVKQAAAQTGENAGDGTTTSTVLAQAMIKKGITGLNAGNDPMGMKTGMEHAMQNVIDELEETTRQVETSLDIKDVGTISANGDYEIGQIIAEAMDAVGKDGVITVEEANGLETYLKIVEGMELEDRGYLSPYFINNEAKQNVSLDNPLIVLYEGKLHSHRDVLKALEIASQQGRSILFIADDVTGEALSSLVVNKIRGAVEACAVKAPGFGDRRQEILRDIAILCGAEVISEAQGGRIENITIEQMGTAEKVTSNRNNTVIVASHNEEALEVRRQQLRTQIEEATSEYDKQKTAERLAKLSGGVAVIYIGAATEVEMKEKKDRLDDALHATKAAVEEGIVPGGGIALLNASVNVKEIDDDYYDTGHSSFDYGYHLVLNACFEPVRAILKNAGLPSELILEKLTKGEMTGYAISDAHDINMYDAGVIDPLKVVRTALENAVSVASTFLTTEAAIINSREDQPNI